MEAIIRINNDQLAKDFQSLLQSYDEQDYGFESIDIRQSKMNIEVDHASLEKQIIDARKIAETPIFESADIYRRREAFAIIKGFDSFNAMVKRKSLFRSKIDYDLFISEGGAKQISKVLQERQI